MSHTLTCLAGLGGSPDSLKKSCNDEFSTTNGFSTISPRSGYRSHDQHPLSSSTSNASNVPSESSFSVSSVKSMHENISSDIEEIFKLRTKYQNNPLIGFLNIKSLRNKIADLKLAMEKCLPDILVMEETKLSSDFKTEIFLVNNFQRSIRLDRNEFGGGLMQFARKGVVCNTVSTF